MGEPRRPAARSGRAAGGQGRLAGPRHNLPLQLTSFVGREQSIAEVGQLLATTRLLTLTGAPGVGKTRLALQLADEAREAYAQGVWLVELAPLADPALVPQAVAAVLGVHEHPGRPLAASLAEALRAQQVLLVLDNCEHLVAPCATLADRLLRACPHLEILATSREALGVAGETTWWVPSLAVPDDISPAGPVAVAALGEYEAVRLFVERARAALPSFTVTESNAAAVGQVCRRLDGIPLALELSAARVRALPVEQLAQRLDDRFRLLTAGSRAALPRQQTLRAAVDWSYALLSEPERVLLRRLAVFAGGWTLEAAEAVCAGDGLAPEDVLELLVQLVNKSLVVVEDHGDERRYSLLETLREYGWEKLREAGEETALRNRHLAWLAALGDQGEPHTWGPDQLAWFERWDGEVDNLRAALAWSQTEAHENGATASASDRADAGLRICWAVVRFWDTRGFLSEGRGWLMGALARAQAPTPARAKALNAAAFLALLQGDFVATRTTLDEALAVAEAAGDGFSRALAVQMLGAATTALGDLDAAAALLEQPLPTLAEVGHETHYYVLNYASLFWRAELALARGEGARWASLLAQGLTLAEARGDSWSRAHSLAALAHVAAVQGEYERATALRQQSLGLRQELRDRRGISDCLEGLAWVASAEGRVDRAARLLGAAEATREMTGFALSPLHHWWGAERDRVVSATRACLGEAAFATGWAEGHAMPLDEVVAYALAVDMPPPVPAPAAAAPSRPIRPVPATQLSEREREVAALIALGCTNRQIAEQLVISQWTADTHVRHILTKL
ncbi:MAG TPA: LuxR C-terminal-related transcriptional regulator, partial [Chloroflexota bacterium]